MTDALSNDCRPPWSTSGGQWAFRRKVSICGERGLKMGKFAFHGSSEEKLGKWKHTLNVARDHRKAVMAEDRYQPKPSIRDSVEGAADAVEEYHQGSK